MEQTSHTGNENGRQKPHDNDIVISYKKLMVWHNVAKLVVLVITIFSAVFSAAYWCFTKIEQVIDKKIEASINKAFDDRLNTTFKFPDNISADLASIKQTQSQQQTYLVNNNHRLNYHERVMKDVVGYLHSLPPHDFIKPEELGFEDFKESNK